MRELGRNLRGDIIVEVDKELYDDFRRIAIVLTREVTTAADGPPPMHEWFWKPFRSFIGALARSMHNGGHQGGRFFEVALMRETEFKVSGHIVAKVRSGSEIK